MKYLSFRIERYKGIDDITVDIANNGNCACLLGMNESGKTSIMKAIELFGRVINGDFPKNGQRNELRPRGNSFDHSVKITAKVQISEDDYKQAKITANTVKQCEKVDIVYELEFSNNTPLDEGKVFSPQIGDAHLGKILKLCPKIIYFEDFNYEIPRQIEIKYSDDRYTTRGVKDFQEDLYWIQVLNDIYKYKDNTKGDIRSDIVDWLTNNPDDITSIDTRVDILNDVLADKVTKVWNNLTTKPFNFDSLIVKHERFDHAVRFTFQIKEKRKDETKTFAVYERSRGARWLIAFILLTTIRKHRSENCLFLLDEPASNLHPSAQEQILSALYELSKNSKVIYSTHSPYLLDAANFANTYVVINDDREYKANIHVKRYWDFVSDIDSGNKGKAEMETLKPALDHIGFKLPSVCLEHSSKPIVFVEGISDFYYILAFADANELSKINLYPGKGAGTLDIHISRAIGEKNKFCVLLDADSAGQNAINHYLDRFGEIIKNNLFTLSDMLTDEMKSNCNITRNHDIVMEDLLDKQDKQSLGQLNCKNSPKLGIQTYVANKNSNSNNNPMPTITQNTIITFDNLLKIIIKKMQTQ